MDRSVARGGFLTGRFEEPDFSRLGGLMARLDGQGALKTLVIVISSCAAALSSS